MDNARLSHKSHDDTPPKKKRRLRPPGFESSFHDVNPYPSKSPRHSTPVASSLSATAEFTANCEVGGSRRGALPVSKPFHLGLGESAYGLFAEEDDNRQPQSHYLHYRDRKRVSASYSKFKSTFNVLRLPSDSKPPFELHSPRLSDSAHTILATELPSTKAREGSSVVSNTVTPRTPLRLLKPPSLREAVEIGSHSLSKTHSPFREKSPHHHELNSKADTDNLSSMMSHLPPFKGAVPRIGSPKRSATEVRNFLSLTPPALQSEPLQSVDETATATSSVSHAQRAEILAGSVRVWLKNQSPNVELSELSRGLALSPLRGHRAHGKKFIKGGLAERAEYLLSRSSTNFSLWQAGFAKHLEGTKHTQEDLRLRVLSILSYTSTMRSFASSVDELPRSAVTRCMEVRQGALDKSQHILQEGTVVFLFASHERVSSALTFQEGKEVCVWRPWQEVELPEVFDQLPLHPERETHPTSRGSPTGRKTVLLCSRFLVLA